MVSSFEHGNLYGVKKVEKPSNGGSHDARLEQIRAGRHYKQYSKDQQPAERSL